MKLILTSLLILAACCATRAEDNTPQSPPGKEKNMQSKQRTPPGANDNKPAVPIPDPSAWLIGTTEFDLALVREGIRLA